MMEFAFPALSGLKQIGCLTQTKAAEAKFDATATPFRTQSLLTDTVAKTCTELTLAQCELEVLPPLIGGFYLLRMLDLSDNNLDELPPDIGSCYSLTSLNVSSNWIKTLPDEMAQLIHLESLLFFSNKISVLPDWLSELPLTDLNGFNNKILKLPPTFGKLCELGEVNLAANIIMQVPLEAVEYWRSVTILNLYDCRLMKLCSFAGLENLEELRLFNNNLDEVPELGSRLNKLKILELNKNHISQLPLAFFSGLRALERIVLNNNEIESIPVGINCPNLESFLISSNKLTDLPPDLPLWPSLRVLFVNSNQIAKLPETFIQNTWIQRVNLSRNNKCTVPSKHILMHLKKLIEKKEGGKYWAPDTL